MEKKQPIDKRVIWIAGFSLFVAFIWVALDSYHELIRKEETEEFEQLLTPLNPHLSTEVLEDIRQRKEYQLEEVEGFFKIEATPTPTKSLSEVEEATESGKTE